jgi:DeoR/GlpR family transcriptional regulator of sugar metabolism
MLGSQRRTHILETLKREGQALAGVLARELDVSEDTIRRDMREMAAQGLIKRVHGGALPVSPELPDFTARRSVASAEKAALGARAAALVKPGQMVFLDGGTTTAEIARQLPRGMALTVATHSPTIASEFEHRPEVEVILIGGRLYKHSMVAVGAQAMAAIDTIRPDLFFLGVTAVHPGLGLTTGDFEEAAIKRHILQASAETYVAVTEEKIDAISPCRIAPIEAIAGLIVPDGIDEERLSPYREAGVTLVA